MLIPVRGAYDSQIRAICQIAVSLLSGLLIDQGWLASWALMIAAVSAFGLFL